MAMHRRATPLPLLLLALLFALLALSSASASHPRHRHSHIRRLIDDDEAALLIHRSRARLGNSSAPSLPRFSQVGGVYVTGVSSGGYMAAQLHVSYSSVIRGSGMFASGPWGCATGVLLKALNACTDDVEPLGLAGLLDAALAGDAARTIDPLANLAGAPVWIFSGQSDATVKRPVANANADFYRAFNADVLYNNASIANHAWVSPLGANPCTVSASPYTSTCGAEFDPPGEMLHHLLRRDLKPPVPTKQLSGKLLSFSQDLYTYAKWGLPAAMLSMADTGFVYVPSMCSDNSTSCDLVVVLHGCQQASSIIGKSLIEQAYVNEYADSNGLIVLYPQTIALTLGVVYNPKACWDWWGFLGDDELYSVKGGFQIETLMAMINAIKA